MKIECTLNLIKYHKLCVLIFFVFLISVSVLSCRTNNSETEKSTTLESIVSKKIMNVGYLEFPPCVIKDKSSGAMSGIFVDMVNQIKKSIDTSITINWVETKLSDFAAGLKTNKFDFCVGPTFVTIPRATSVFFTSPICFVGNKGAVLKGEVGKYNSLEKLNSKNVRIGVLQGQAMESFCKTYLPNATLVSIPGSDLNAPLQAVVSGRADIGFMNVMTTGKFVNEHSELELVSINNDNLEVLPLSWTTKINDYSLQNFLNSSILYLESTGRIEEYQKKYSIKLLYRQNNLLIAK